MRLRIVHGRRRGKEFPIGEEPVLIGRDPACAILLTEDQLVSARHAELAVDPQGQLVIRDLESVNGTDVNGEAIGTAELNAGDEITIGNTVFEVIAEVSAADASAAPPPSQRGRRERARKETRKAPPPPPEEEAAGEEAEEAAADEEHGEAGPGLDFGERTAERGQASLARRILSLSLTALITLVVIAGGVYIGLEFQRTQPRLLTGTAAAGNRVELSYEKVQAGKQNIFRFAMRISGGKVTLNIDDLKQRRHVQKDKAINERVLNELLSQLDRGGFDNLKAKYGGLPAEQQETAVIELTRGARFQRVEVENTIAPDGFVAVQKALEDFAQMEMGLLALSKPREELIKEAEDNFLAGKRFFEAREVEFPNLYNAIKRFQVVQSNLETIEPKPETYKLAVAMETEAREMLNKITDNLRFNADRAIKLAEWSKARDALQQLMQRLPDRDDERYREAERRLISVQTHLRR
jgi:hypothetical protein